MRKYCTCTEEDKNLKEFVLRPACPGRNSWRKIGPLSLQHRLEMAIDLITALVIGTYKI
jgi:hypothetical protein